MKISVLGSGSWGSALSQVLADNHHEVVLWGHNASQIDDINTNGENSQFFPGVKLNRDIHATCNLEDTIGSDIFVLCVPSIAIEEVCLKLNTIMDKPAIVVNTAKGFHPKDNKRMSEVIREYVNPEKLRSVVSLIGPSHAEEVVLRKLTTICAISLNDSDAKEVQETFSNNYLRVYTGNDEIGSEIGVALKNSIALASGILSGLGYGDNTRAALITRGIAEIIRFGTYFGGRRETFIGLTGIGDLIVTCTSEHSRNFKAGEQIGRTNNADIYWKTNKTTCEGVRTTKVAYEIAKEHNIEMPIITEIYKVLYEGKEPSISAKDLMLRSLKAED